MDDKKVNKSINSIYIMLIHTSFIILVMIKAYNWLLVKVQFIAITILMSWVQFIDSPCDQ